MKRTRGELKLMARRALAGNYSTAAAGSILSSMMIGFVVMMIYAALIVMLLILMATGFQGRGFVLVFALGLLMLVLFFIVILATQLLNIGYIRLCCQICVSGRAEISDLFYPFRNHPLKFCGAALLIWLMSIAVSIPGIVVNWLNTFFLNGFASVLVGIIAWLLIYIPGVLITLRYFMIYYILIENPEYRILDAFRQSKYLMEGNMGRLFILSLSFTGWIILGYASFGIGYLWIIPYILCTMVNFYLTVKEEKYDKSNEM